MAVTQEIIDRKRGFSETRWSSLALSQRALIAILCVLFACRVILAATAELAEDEAYYWLWSTHLAAGYYDHPAMVAYWIRFGSSLFGNTEFGIRFVDLLSIIAASALLYYGSLSLFGDRGSAALAVVWLNSTLLANAAAILSTPDTPLAFFAGCAIFSLAKLTETKRGAWWYAAGASLGLAFASKYTAALLFPGLLFWVVALPENRRWLLRHEVYLGAVIGMVCVLPTVLWNRDHDWASFAKQAYHGIKDQPVNRAGSFGDFLAGQAGLVTPLIFGFCIFAMGFALWRGMRSKDPRWLLLGSVSAPVFLFFSIHSFSQKIQPNWPAFLYGAAVIAAVQAFRELKAPKAKWLSFAFEAAPFIGVAISLLAFAQLGLDLIPISSKKDPTSRLKGWSTLAADIEAVRKTTGASLILTDRYALTGELAFYLERPEGVVQVNERVRYLNLPPPAQSQLKDPALLVVKSGQTIGTASAAFERHHLVTTIRRDSGVQSQDLYDVYLLTDYRGGLFSGPGH